MVILKPRLFSYPHFFLNICCNCLSVISTLSVVQVHILPPSGMEFRADMVEVEVGSVLELPLDVMTTLHGKTYSFNDCRNMPLNVTFTDPSVVTYMEGMGRFYEIHV